MVVIQPIDAIILDADGTLLNTIGRQHDWFKHYHQEIHGDRPFPFANPIEFSERYNETLAGGGSDYRSGVQKFYDDLGLPCDMWDMVGHPVWPKYNAYKDEHPTGLFDGIKTTLHTIYDFGSLGEDAKQTGRLRMAVNTNNTWKSIAKELKKNEVLHLFDSQVGAEVLKRYARVMDGAGVKKPSPAAVAYSLAQLKTSGNRIMHVADTRGDLIASRDVIVPGKEFEGSQNLLMVGAAWGYEGRKLLEQGGELPDSIKVKFDYIIDHPEELIDIVKKHWRA